MAQSKKTIRFLKHNYDNVTSSLGQLWPGREVTIDEKAANEFIKLGYAEDVKAKPAAKEGGNDVNDDTLDLTKEGLEKHTVKQLTEIAEKMQIEVPERIKKDDLVDLILQSVEETKGQE